MSFSPLDGFLNFQGGFYSQRRRGSVELQREAQPGLGGYTIRPYGHALGVYPRPETGALRRGLMIRLVGADAHIGPSARGSEAFRQAHHPPSIS